MGRLSEIETFVLVAEKGSFSAASRSLGISTAAVSKQLSKLEASLGIQLLVRSTRNVELTEVGKVYLEQCKRIMEEVDVSNTLLSQMKVEPSGTLHIFSPKHFAERIIIPHLAGFSTLCPKVEVDLTIGERIPHLESEGVDILIGASVSAQENTVQKRIGTTKYVICGAKEYFKKYGMPQTPDELIHHKCIAHSGRQPCDSFYGNQGKEIKFKPFMKVNDAQSLAQLAVQGLGIVQVHSYVVEELIEKKKLVSILDDYSRSNVPIYYSLPSRKFIPRKVQCFIEYILSKLNSEGETK